MNAVSLASLLSLTPSRGHQGQALGRVPVRPSPLRGRDRGTTGQWALRTDDTACNYGPNGEWTTSNPRKTADSGVLVPEYRGPGRPRHRRQMAMNAIRSRGGLSWGLAEIGSRTAGPWCAASVHRTEGSGAAEGCRMPAGSPRRGAGYVAAYDDGISCGLVARSERRQPGSAPCGGLCAPIPEGDLR